MRSEVSTDFPHLTTRSVIQRKFWLLHFVVFSIWCCSWLVLDSQLSTWIRSRWIPSTWTRFRLQKGTPLRRCFCNEVAHLPRARFLSDSTKVEWLKKLCYALFPVSVCTRCDRCLRTDSTWTPFHGCLRSGLAFGCLRPRLAFDGDFAFERLSSTLTRLRQMPPPWMGSLSKVDLPSTGTFAFYGFALDGYIRPGRSRWMPSTAERYHFVFDFVCELHIFLGLDS
jgi:hypothetical protein